MRLSTKDVLGRGADLKTLYVGNLPWSTTEERLSQVFSVHGPVNNCRIITDRETGRSRGFGFVEVDDSAADAMVTALNNTNLDGRLIVVNEARPRQDRM
jgi:RNA recognition motif-containing protein